MMTRKTVGLLTLQNSNNYGAMYQAFALSKYLKKLGNDVFILDYEMTRDGSSFFGYLKHPLSFLQKLIYRRDLIAGKLSKKESSSELLKRKEAFSIIFNEFRERNLEITATSYDYQSLVEGLPHADVFISGSDQVWAADFLFTSPAFLLGFVPSDVKKVSYAASFGKTKLEPYLKGVFKEYIAKFDAVSVREKTGVDIVKSTAKLDSVHVLDPTMLLDKSDYVEIIDYSLVPKGKYILVYKLDQDKKLSDWADLCINSIAERGGFSILAVSTNLRFPFDSQWEEAFPTPGQLLGLIEMSSLTITNSFHGTVFSILLQTKFLSFARDIYKDKQNLRMQEMLECLGLAELYCEPFLAEGEVAAKLNSQCEFDKVAEKLSELRMVSKKFLDGAVQ